jgi:hypothetical protein
MTKNIGRKGCKSCGKKDCRGCGRKDCKKKGGALGINEGIYHFADKFTIDIFADLEGNMPDEIEKLTNFIRMLNDRNTNAFSFNRFFEDIFGKMILKYYQEIEFQLFLNEILLQAMQ